MVNFAELKAKAEKAKDASVTKMTNTRDRYLSVPSSKVNWDRNRAPPAPPAASMTSGPSSSSPPPSPPPRSRPEITASDTSPPVAPRAPRPTDGGDQPAPAPPPYTPPPPPVRATSGYPPSHRVTTSQDAAAMDKIDWAHLSAEDKEAFFGWLDEFFSQYLGIEVGPAGARRAGPSVLSVVQGTTRPSPAVNMATRPRV